MNEPISFMSSYPHTLDDKGRLALPGKLRDELKKSVRPDEMVAFAGEEGCVTLYTQEHWREVEDSIVAIEDTDDRNEALDYYMGNAERLSLDKAGRLLLPAHHRKTAGLEREVMVVGQSYKIVIRPRTADDELETAKSRKPKPETIKKIRL
jgi:Uncharacterized protein conserved in bacteria